MGAGQGRSQITVLSTIEAVVAWACRWANRVLEEFFLQGDQERAQGLPVSPLMDRHTTSLAISQINFIEFVVAPLFHQVPHPSPTFSPLISASIRCLRKESQPVFQSFTNVPPHCGVLASAAFMRVQQGFMIGSRCHSSNGIPLIFLLSLGEAFILAGPTGRQGVPRAEGNGAVPVGESAPLERALHRRH